MTKFWGALFGINFAMGVATGITMEFQFGMNWAYYSHYVGDVFGAPLAIEGLMAFFLEATFIGLFFFGWDKLSRGAHLAVTWLVALGSNLSALWILIANGWMQHPVGSHFNPDTMRMEVTDFAAVIFNPVAQAKFVHTVSAGYVTGSDLRARHQRFVSAARPSHRDRQTLDDGRRELWPRLRAFGRRARRRERLHRRRKPEDENRRHRGDVGHEPAPAPFTLFGLPNQATHTTDYEVSIPWMLGLIDTRSLSEEVPGINQLVAHARERIRSASSPMTR